MKEWDITNLLLGSVRWLGENNWVICSCCTATWFWTTRVPLRQIKCLINRYFQHYMLPSTVVLSLTVCLVVWTVWTVLYHLTQLTWQLSENTKEVVALLNTTLLIIVCMIIQKKFWFSYSSKAIKIWLMKNLQNRQNTTRIIWGKHFNMQIGQSAP